VFPGSRPPALPTATTRDRGCLSLFASIGQEVLGMSSDPDVGQQRLQVHLGGFAGSGDFAGSGGFAGSGPLNGFRAVAIRSLGETR
jgi:hypothetical protein